MEALGSDLPRLEFVDLLAGFELFTRTGTALPEATIECVVYKLGCEKEIWTCVLTGFTTGPCGSRIALYSVPSGRSILSKAA